MRDNAPSLYLVGESIDAKSAHRRAQSGEITQLMRGVYVGAESSVDAVVLGFAVRIAHYLYPHAYLSAVSSLSLAPSADGRLFLGGRRNQRTRLRALEIVQNEAPDHPSTVGAVIGDQLGELRMEISSPRQRFLEAFRLRSEHASAIDDGMRKQMAARLVREYGSPRAAADALWVLARDNQWYREGEGAERYLLQQPAAAPAVRNKAALDLAVAWHGESIGRLTHDGSEWRWKADRRTGPSLVRETKPGRLPAFIESLLPEGWLARVLPEHDDREALQKGRRYTSNITIVPFGESTADLTADVLTVPLSDFLEAGRFTGRYAGPSRGELHETFEQNLARLFDARQTPRLSGVQIKAPMSLLRDGSLVPASERPFTHILKPAGSAGFERLPVVEWLCLELGRAAGFEVPSAALLDMPDDMPPALVVERFDIRRAADDTRRLALEDFCSILDLPPSAKYDGTIERMAKALRALSSDPAADLDVLFRRAVFAWLIADGDMHLKNLAVLKIASADQGGFSAVRFAPLYDAVSTRVFPQLAGDRMALKLNGKDDRLTTNDFLALAKTMGLTRAAAVRALHELSERLEQRVRTLQVPRRVGPEDAGRKAVLEALSTIVLSRCAALTSARLPA